MRLRQSARLVLLNRANQILLFRYEDASSRTPDNIQLASYWVTPGGGLETGEDFEQAARRELREETGLTDAAIGPWLWLRELPLYFPNGEMLSHERYFLARFEGLAEDISQAGMLEDERRTFREYRWWSLDALKDSGEIFYPPDLAALLEPILAGQLPAEPLILPN